MIHLNNVVIEDDERGGLNINEGIPAGYNEPLGHRAISARSTCYLLYSLCIRIMSIRSLNTGRIYIGQIYIRLNKSLEDRLRDHNAGYVQSKRKISPGSYMLYRIWKIEKK